MEGEIKPDPKEAYSPLVNTTTSNGFTQRAAFALTKPVIPWNKSDRALLEYTWKFKKDPANTTQPKVDLILLIDTSARANGFIQNDILASIQSIFEQLDPVYHRVCIIAVNDEAHVITDLYKFGFCIPYKSEYERLMNVLKSVNPNGDLNPIKGLEAAMKIAFNRGLSIQDTSQQCIPDTHLLFFTAAKTGLDDTSLHAFKNQLELKAPELVIHAFGYGYDHNIDFLQTLALTPKNKGYFYFIETGSDIKKQFGLVLKTITRNCTKDLTLIFTANTNCRIDWVRTPFEQNVTANKEVFVFIGRVSEGEKKTIVMALSLEALERIPNEETPLMTVFQKYTDPHTQRRVSQNTLTMTRHVLVDQNDVPPIITEQNYFYDVAQGLTRILNRLQRSEELHRFGSACNAISYLSEDKEPRDWVWQDLHNLGYFLEHENIGVCGYKWGRLLTATLLYQRDFILDQMDYKRSMKNLDLIITNGLVRAIQLERRFCSGKLKKKPQQPQIKPSKSGESPFKYKKIALAPDLPQLNQQTLQTVNENNSRETQIVIQFPKNLKGRFEVVFIAHGEDKED